MGCFKPNQAYRGPGGEIVFDRVKSLSKISFLLPCGQCIGCRMSKANEWGIRCMHEARMHPHSCFVTLTYNDDFLPDGMSLCKRDLQLFMKRLRKAREPSKIRFFAGAEYGDDNNRPHYHLLLFNVCFADQRFHGKNKRGEDLFTSQELSDLWLRQGFCTIGAVTMDSAVYCAKYALKKIGGDRAYEHYQFFDESGNTALREPEFALMSRRPGLGMSYYDKYGQEVRDNDNVIVGGRKAAVPRFYDTKTELASPATPGMIDKSVYGRIKALRKRKAVLAKADNTPERLRVKEVIAVAAARKKERKL